MIFLCGNGPNAATPFDPHWFASDPQLVSLIPFRIPRVLTSAIQLPCSTFPFVSRMFLFRFAVYFLSHSFPRMFSQLLNTYIALVPFRFPGCFSVSHNSFPPALPFASPFKESEHILMIY